MNTQFQELLNNVSETFQNIENESDLLKFEDTIVRISEFNNSDAICPLLLSIPETTTLDEAAFSIIHYVETFDDDIYIKKLFDCLDVFYSKSPYWCCVVVLRIINNDISLTKLINHIEGDISKREILRVICNNISINFPSVSEKIKSSDLYAML